MANPTQQADGQLNSKLQQREVAATKIQTAVKERLLSKTQELSLVQGDRGNADPGENTQAIVGEGGNGDTGDNNQPAGKEKKEKTPFKLLGLFGRSKKKVDKVKDGQGGSPRESPRGDKRQSLLRDLQGAKDEFRKADGEDETEGLRVGEATPEEKQRASGPLDAAGIRRSILEVRDAVNEVRRSIAAPPEPLAAPPVVKGKGIFVTIVRAYALRDNADGLDGSSDPFCTCEIAGKASSRFGTGVIMDNPNPIWEHRRQIVDYSEGDKLSFTVWDWDDNTVEYRDGAIVGTDQLGSCEFHFEDYYPNGCEMLLELPDSLQKPAPTLFVKVEIEGKPASAEKIKTPRTVSKLPKLPAAPPVVAGKGIVVTIMSASGLRNNSDSKNGASDPFCTCSFLRKDKANFSTCVIVDNPNPVWDHKQQILEYDEGDILKFTVGDWDANGLVRDGIIVATDQLGSCTLAFDDYYPKGCLKQLAMSDSLNKPHPTLKVKVEIEGQPKINYKKRKPAKAPTAKPPPEVVKDKGIFVTIISASGLKNADNDGGKPDPWCECSIRGKQNSKFQTGVIIDDNKPKWNYRRQIVDYAEGEDLKFVVWDWDGDEDVANERGDLLGECELKYFDYYPNGCEKHLMMQGRHKPYPTLFVRVEINGKPAPGAETLKKQKAAKDAVDIKVADKDKVELSKAEVAGKGIVVTIVSASGLRNADAEHGGFSDPYCTFEIPRKKESRFESHVVGDSLNPVWNFSRQIEEYAEGDPLKFVVWDKDPGLGKDMLGKCELPFSAYYPAGGEHRLELPAIRKPYPTLLVRIKVLGEPIRKEITAKAKAAARANMMFGRRVPKKDSELSPRTQAREDARRKVLYMKQWSENLRGEDEFTDLIPSNKARPDFVKKGGFGFTDAHQDTYTRFLDFILLKGGNYARAWRVFVDPEWHGRITKIDLGKHCRKVGFNGNLKALWEVLDSKQAGWVTLMDLHKRTAQLLARFYCALESRRRVEEKQRLVDLAERGEPEPEHQPEEVGNNDGTRLMKVLDVDDTRKLTKGEFVCSVTVLQLGSTEEANELFTMLHFSTPAMACHNHPSNAVVTEEELQWLHNICTPFNLFSKLCKRGKEKPKQVVLTEEDRVEAQKALLTKGRLRKVWAKDPAVFGRLFDDAERREYDAFHRFDDDGITKIAEPEVVNDISDRLYGDAYTREAHQQMAEEAAWEKAILDANGGNDEAKKLDKLHLDWLAQSKQERKYRSNADRRVSVEAKAGPQRKPDMERIDRMVEVRKQQLEDHETRRQENERKKEEQDKRDAELAKQPINEAERKIRERIWRKMLDEDYERAVLHAKEHGLPIPEKKSYTMESAWKRLQRDASVRSKKTAKITAKEHPKVSDEHDLALILEDDRVFRDLVSNLHPEDPLPLPEYANVDDPPSASTKKEPRKKTHMPRAQQLRGQVAKSLPALEALQKAGLVKEVLVEEGESDEEGHELMEEFWWVHPETATKRKSIAPGMEVWSASEDSSEGEFPDLATQQNPLRKPKKKRPDGQYIAHTCFPSKDWREHHNLLYVKAGAPIDPDISDRLVQNLGQDGSKKAWDGPQRQFTRGRELKKIGVAEIEDHTKVPAYPARRKSLPAKQFHHAPVSATRAEARYERQRLARSKSATPRKAPS